MPIKNHRSPDAYVAYGDKLCVIRPLLGTVRTTPYSNDEHLPQSTGTETWRCCWSDRVMKIKLTSRRDGAKRDGEGTVGFSAKSPKLRHVPSLLLYCRPI